MSETAGEVLSREELDAILSSLQTEAEPAAERRQPTRSLPGWRAFPMARALREYADEHARSLSTVFQRPITFSLISLESVPAGDFSASMLETDLPVLIDYRPRGVVGSLLVGRTLLYGWLGMAYGGRVGSKLCVPDRPYTAIEVRFLKRCVEQLVAPLARGLGMEPPPSVTVGDFVEPALLADLAAPRLRVASFDAEGFGDVARLRIAIPEELCSESGGRRSSAAELENRGLARALLEVPVQLRAEVGWAEIGLHAVSRLAPGVSIDLDSVVDTEVVVRLEGEAKFHAQRGRSGDRAAIRITEKL